MREACWLLRHQYTVGSKDASRWAQYAHPRQGPELVGEEAREALHGWQDHGKEHGVVCRGRAEEKVNVFIGYDARQPVAFHVAAHSVWRRSSKPVQILPLRLEWMPIKRRGLTEFTYSRFLVPFLSNYEGWSLFMDSDEMVLGDVQELAALAIPSHDLTVIQGQHRYE